MDNNIQNKAIQAISGMQKDLDDSYSSDKILTHARNAMVQTINGNTPIFTNEPSNLHCLNLPYKYNGNIELKENRYLIFSTDNVNSEIGIAEINNCKYTKLVNNQCLNLNQNYSVYGAMRQNLEGDEIVIFADKYNEDRILNLSKIPYIYSVKNDVCETKEFSNELDCSEILLNPKIKFPCITTSKGNLGSIPDGVFQIAIAYSINKFRFTDYLSLTTPEFINNESGTSSITVKIENLDRNFDEYSLLLIGRVNGIETAKVIGYYPTSNNQITISDWENSEYQTIPATEYTSNKINYDKSSIISSNSQYLIRGNLERKSTINYQKQAFKIKAKYVVKQVPLDYYKEDGTDIGYFRDENMRYFIRWFHTDGEPIEDSIIPCRKATSSDLAIAKGDDVWELTDQSCDPKTNIRNWQVYNTASEMIPQKNDFKCNERIIGSGQFGFNESTEKFPEDVNIFGDRACTPLTDHRFPDECKVPRYTNINGDIYINILGVEFSNIEYPKDELGNPIPNIAGYEILRSERDQANKTVISRGIITNTLSYTDDNKIETAFANFPFNSLEPNQFLSKKQTFVKGKSERNFKPLTDYYTDKFNYYTPSGRYFGRDRLSNYFQIETEESGVVNGYFEDVFNHPKHKLLSDFSLFTAVLAGLLETYLALKGKVVTTKQSNGNTIGEVGGGTSILGSNPGATTTTPASLGRPSLFPTTIITTESDNPLALTKIRKEFSLGKKVLIAAENVLKIFAYTYVGLKIAAEFANKALDIIFGFVGYEQYAKQFNSEVLYNTQKCIGKGNKRRKVLRQPFYLDNGIASVGSLRVNNGGRNSSIFVEFEKSLPETSIKDTSRNTITGFGIDYDPSKRINSKSSVYYVTNKQLNPNQYGTLDSTKKVKIHSCLFFTSDTNKKYETGPLFGGDCIIYEETIINKFPIFKQDLSNANYPNGIPYDYRLYPNIGYPRYWFDSTEHNIGSLIDIFGVKAKAKRPSISKLPNRKYNLDGNQKSGKWNEENRYMYTSINGVIRFIAEAEFNGSFRKNEQETEKTGIYQPHYSKNQKDLSYIFRSDFKEKPEGFILDPSYRFLDANQISSSTLTEILDLSIREKNTISYSLPALNTQKFNNWQYFLPANYFTFDESKFGSLTGIHPLDQDRLIFLFSNTSPFVSLGRNELKTTTDNTITIGDGGLFAQQPRELMVTDIAYGSNHDKFAFKSTQFGHFYVSRNQGKIFEFSNNLDEISRNGFQAWCRKYMPLQLSNYFPEYTHLDNPSNSVGYLIGFDNQYETIYISKRDFIPKGNIKFNKEKDQFEFNGAKVSLQSEHFQDISWTLSFHCPTKTFVSFHDWHPDEIIQTENHFVTIKDKSIWKHNERCDSYCNFYGKNYPHELEFTLPTGQTTILSNIEYLQESYNYPNDCRDKYEIFCDTFDTAMVFNQEQHSGLLNLEYAANKRGLFEIYPKVTNANISIPFDKVERVTRFNMFRDMTRDRGEISSAEYHMFNISPNGYERIINPLFINYQKPIREQKRFRSNVHKVWLSKKISNSTNLITKFNNFKIITSPR